MSIASELDSAIGPKSRRAFLQAMGAAGISLMGRRAWSAALPESLRQSLVRKGKAITLLEDGGFQGSAWGWQFTEGAKVADHSRRAERKSVQVHTESGDYARFLVLGPEIGKSYTLSGWVKTEGIVQQEEAAGAYFTASQFEFQGRPTEYTVDGKQIPEKRFGNFTGTAGWQRFSQSFTCLPGTTWFEVVVGIYRASGSAWFTELTFVEGEAAVEFDDAVDYWQALEWAHNDAIESGARAKPTAAILRDALPVRGAASDPAQLAKVLGESYDVAFLTADELADPKRLNHAAFDLLVLPYGESFPLPARAAVEGFLGDGGDLLSTGGYAFQSPLISKNGRWEFYDDVVRAEGGQNLLPDFAVAGTAWAALEPKYASGETMALPGAGEQRAGKISVPANLWSQNAAWYCDLPAGAECDQYFLEGWIRTEAVRPVPDGYAYAGFEQLDEKGEEIYAAGLELERIQGARPWHKLERLICLAPGCRKLRVGFGLKNATGAIWGARFRLERRLPQVRINTAEGFPQDELQVTPQQIGIFDADFRLKRVSAIRPATGQQMIAGSRELTGAFEGYAATCVVGMNQARWMPLLEAFDGMGRKRGAAGALVHHLRGAYGRGSWAFFGVENQDIFSAGSALGESTLRAVSKALTNKCSLHAFETDFASYRQGEPVRLRVLATNLSRKSATLEFRWRIAAKEAGKNAFQASRKVMIAPGQTARIETGWHPASFASSQYRATVQLAMGSEVIDQLETGFVVWITKTLSKGLAFEFKENYFQVGGRSLFLQGTDDYLHTFIDQDENPLTWQNDAQGCRDSCIDVYENLMGLRGPQHRPTKTWWRWIDAMLLNVQSAGGVFFPGMLIFSNTAVSDKDLADQQAYVEAFAARYKDAAGIIYYLNGDLELHDPNLPDIQKLYNRYLQEKYGSDEALRKAWLLSPPEAPIGKLTISTGKDDWRDVRTLDDFEFRTQVVRRWLNSLYDSIRKVDQRHPVTAEFYQLPLSGIDLLTALGRLELANFGYFNSADEDFYRFPQVCKFLDQSVRGKGLNVGEFGVKTHPAWRNASDYIAARSEAYEQAYFLAIAHYGFALGASKIQNWSWKYPSDLPFEWGINYPNELIARDVRAFYRNSGLFFRRLRPRYEPGDLLLLIPGENRKGGQGMRILEGISNSIRLLIDQRVSFSTLADEFIDEVPANVKTIFYPLPYCPNEKVIARLTEFVAKGGQLYLSGEISYDGLRQRTQTQRLKELCGVEFVSERYANIDYQNGALPVVGKAAGWPDYVAAPGIVMRLAGADSLVESRDGMPVVTEFQLGKGRVIFSADPIELHGDPRYQPYAHAFYHALCQSLHLRGEMVEPAQAPVHCFRIPSQDAREIVVLVNYSETDAVRDVVIPCGAGAVSLSLNARISGAVVAEKGKGVHAVESSADVRVNQELLIGSDLHFMALSMDEHPLASSHALLLLPMGEGQLQISGAGRWRQPVVLVGEVTGARWKEYESFRPERSGKLLKLPIHAERSLSMMILCEDANQAAAVKEIEAWVNQPWSLASD
jgi:hypothetical protein